MIPHFIIVCMLVPSIVWAWQLGDTGFMIPVAMAPDGAPAPQLRITTSKGVLIEYVRGPNGVSYVLGTYHQSGTKTYATSWGNTQLYSASQTEATLPSPPATANETANFPSIWNPM